jgi:hypothetical protein
LKNHSQWLRNHLEAQKTKNSQGNIEQKEQHWRYHNNWLQTILQSHGNRNSMGQAQKQTQGTQSISRRKDSLLKQCCWENWICACRKLKLDPCVSPSISINSSGLRTFT